MKVQETTPAAAGRVRLHSVADAGPRALLTPWRSNLVLYEWGAIVGRLLATGGAAWKIGAMYLEYENVASPGDAVTPPPLSRDADQGVDYYNALAASADRDYLRVAVMATTLESSDEVRYPKGNMLRFLARTGGVAGVHGKPFSDANNSRIFGAALVAAPSWADATQDLVFSRFYLEAADQQVKLPSSQIDLEWEIKLR